MRFLRLIPMTQSEALINQFDSLDSDNELYPMESENMNQMIQSLKMQTRIYQKKTRGMMI